MFFIHEVDAEDIDVRKNCGEVNDSVYRVRVGADIALFFFRKSDLRELRRKLNEFFMDESVADK